MLYDRHMTELPRIAHRPSVCPHDCPSACSLEVEVIDGRSIGRVRGSKRQSYTDGVICAKVARYAERIHHPDRLLHPMRRTGEKGSGQFERISWDEALDEIAHRFLAIEAEHGAEAVWPYYYAGTHQPPAPCQALFRPVFDDLHDDGLDRLHRRHRAPRGP
jgi:anaerobic selenocysteine-containing dehydrogenase